MSKWTDFRNDIKPNWCNGCGDYSVQVAIQKSVANLGVEPHELAVVSGIGCSGRISGYINAYGVHSIHGRALPIAQGIKIANKDLTVIAAGGDGDGFAIGLAHTIHAMRRNIDMTYIVMDNHIYGLTKGQVSPRSEYGFSTKSTPHATVEQPLSALELALTSGATFVAQGFSNDIKELTELVEAGIAHKGFSFINVLSPCVTYNKINTVHYFKEKLKKTCDIPDYNTSNRAIALQQVIEHNDLLTGIIYQNQMTKSYDELIGNLDKLPLKDEILKITPSEFEKLIGEFM